MANLLTNTYIIVCVFFISSVTCRLVFPKGSDVGYVVADNDERGDEEIIKEELDKQASATHHPRNTIKRAFQDDLNQKELENLADNEEESSTSSAVYDGVPKGMEDSKHGVVMGVKNIKCDNGKVNLTRDWDLNPVNYTCYTPKNRLKVRYDLQPFYHNDDVPKHYYPKHYCMFREIVYNSTLPTFGPHRPLWPLWGEYTFLPIQRWLHALEHGAIVMLYHPCTEPTLVNQLRTLVTGCIYKHVIAAYNLLPVDRPLTLVAWGCYMQMSTVDENLVKTFIIKKSLHGPEGKYTKHGKYTYGQLKNSTAPIGSNVNDTVICPKNNLA